MYIYRSLEQKIKVLMKEYACLLVVGPRQVGKSTMINKIDNKKREVVSLDNLTDRKLAKTDPEMFLKIHKAPLIIDEVQYAPELFSYIKIAIDNGVKPSSYLLSGSQSFKLMELAKESLAGRIGIIHLSNLTQNEIFCPKINDIFEIDIEKLNKRNYKKCDIVEFFDRIFNGQMPALISKKYNDREFYYNSYIETYIERDVSEDIKGIDKVLFSDFIRACACRIAQVLNVHSLATDVGISDDTAKRWLKILEKAEIIYMLRPYSNNLLKRTIKMSKMYFFDTGLVAKLLRYTNSEILMNGSINGSIYENYIINEIRKSYLNKCMEPPIYYYRDVDGNEIDLCIVSNGMIFPIEIKKTSNPDINMVIAYKKLEKIDLKVGKGCIICMCDKLNALNKNVLVVPAWMI